MFETNSGYWYKDSLIKMPNKEVHPMYIKKNFLKLFPRGNINDINDIKDDFRKLNAYALDRGYAKLRIDRDSEGKVLYIHYGSNFNKRKELYNVILENLNPTIKQITIETDGANVMMSINDFLSNENALPKNKSFSNSDGMNFDFGDIVKLIGVIEDIKNLIGLKKGDIGIIIDRHPIQGYNVFWKGKGRHAPIEAKNLELVKKFEWPE